MSTITVFTPSYNRAYCLNVLYESLLNQSNKNFIWMIIDDGSTDNTQELVESWKNENIINITYIYKDNGGMHTAHNVAYDNIKTPLNICIDSDDSMPIDAIDKILTRWPLIKNNKNIAGMVGLDEDINRKIIGTKFPFENKETKLGELYHKYKIKGDKKLVYKTEITKGYPRYPEYDSEKLVPLDTLYILIDRDYNILCFNDCWCIVDYQIDGSSNTIYKQYFQSSNGFRYSRKIGMMYGFSYKYRIRSTIHYIMKSILLRDKRFITNSPDKLHTILLFPIGLLGYFYLNTKR